MSRYTGPRVKVMRALGTELPGLSAKKPERRPYPPGQHGQARKRRSEFGLRLLEKQKIRMNYGVTERQLRTLVQEARRSSEATGHKLVELLERRLDNIVFRAGFARSIPEARQLVNHGHIEVDGERVDIASYRVSQGQVVSVKEASKALQPLKIATSQEPNFQTPWLDVDRKAMSARVTALPDETAALFPLQVQLVVEYYSARL
jgi:small subunit ribosomal protein S4